MDIMQVNSLSLEGFLVLLLVFVLQKHKDNQKSMVLLYREIVSCQVTREPIRAQI